VAQGKGAACEAGCAADNAAMKRTGGDKKTKAAGGRAERLAAALRENLRRRKAQERERRARRSLESLVPAPRDEKGR
jgi:hypothetical protein